jgi:membrane protein DedA with SNARE-associated domain
VNLDHLAVFLLDPGIPPAVVYAVVFGSCILESFFPPWPTDIIAVYAGFLAGRGVVAPSLVFLAAVLGTQVGVLAVFWMCRRWGRSLLNGPMRRYVPVEQLWKLEVWFARYGAPAIAVSRFLPGIRALVMPAAGLADFPAWKVCIFAGIAVVVWNAFVVGIGLWAGSHLVWATDLLVRYSTVAGGLVTLALAGWVAWAVYRRLARPHIG